MWYVNRIPKETLNLYLMGLGPIGPIGVSYKFRYFLGRVQFLPVWLQVWYLHMISPTYSPPDSSLEQDWSVGGWMDWPVFHMEPDDHDLWKSL